MNRQSGQHTFRVFRLSALLVFMILQECRQKRSMNKHRIRHKHIKELIRKRGMSLILILAIASGVEVNVRAAETVNKTGVLQSEQASCRTGTCEAEYVAGEVLVLCDGDISEKEIQMLAEKQGGENPEIISQTESVTILAIDIPESMSVEDAVTGYIDEGNVLAATPNYEIELFDELPEEMDFLLGEKNEANDESLEKQEYLKQTDALRAWEILKAVPHKKVKVAVLDTGADIEHPDLKNIINIEESCELLDEAGTTGPLLGDGYIKGILSENGGGHGTHVSGLIAAEADNGIGIAGAGSAGDNSVIDLMVVDIFSKDTKTSLKYLIEGMEYAKNHGAKILNMSLGMKYNSFDDTMLKAACDALAQEGMIIICAAGNYGLEDSEELSVVPSDYNSTISVIALKEDNVRNDSSCYGFLKDISAPGKDIYSTKKDGDYGVMSGTSMAAPQVTAAAAMVCSLFPEVTVKEMKDLLHNSATDIGIQGFDMETAYGLLNMRKMLEEVTGDIWIASELPYMDMTENEWYYESAAYLYQYGIMTGLDEKTFGGAETIKRAQFAVMLYRFEGEPEVLRTDSIPENTDTSGFCIFPDVPEGEFYTEAVKWAASSGIIRGYENGYFGPADEITREQIAAMLYRYAEYKHYTAAANGDIMQFQDYDMVTEFARQAMEWAVGCTIIKGNGEGLLMPWGMANRAECAAMIQRFMKKY